jgi:nucleotide-binding universal stress UspA family protein
MRHAPGQPRIGARLGRAVRVQSGGIDIWSFLKHDHLDHCGRLSPLVKRGFKGEIIATAATRELARVVILDAAHLGSVSVFVEVVEQGESRSELFSGGDVVSTACSAPNAFGLCLHYPYQSGFDADRGLVVMARFSSSTSLTMTDKAPTTIRFKRILAATDGSEGATTALRSAIEIALHMPAELVVLNVFEPEEMSAIQDPGPQEFARVEHLRGDHAKAKEIISEGILEEAKRIVTEHEGLRASFVFLVGDPATEILRHAEEVAADLIVMGSRGRGHFVGLLLGSVSQKVTSTAQQFVMIAPARK